MKYLLISLLLVFGCRHHKSSPNKSVDNTLAEQYEIYKDLAPRGFIYTDKCDSLLFSSLLAVARGETIDIESAKSEDDQWFRRPNKDCFAKGESKSTISRDMFTGLFVYILQYRRDDLAKQIWDYGVKHRWNMGQAESPKISASRTYFTPVTISLLAQIRYKISGVDIGIRHLIPVYSTQPGYRSHLSMLSIYTSGEVNGKISEKQLDTLREIKTKMPENALAEALLARYTGGDYTRATQMLLQQYPRDRLPTSADWCDSWLNQEMSKSEPCDDDETYSGGDFLFVAAIILNKI